MARIQPPIAQPHNKLRSAVHGPTETLKTQGAMQVPEHIAVRTLQSVSDRDLDAFLRARANKAAAQQTKGFWQSIVGLFASKPKETTAQAMRGGVQHTIGQLSNIYADGFVTEHELGALSDAKGRLEAVLRLAEPDVLMMLPRDVRGRLEAQLFEPLQVLHAAASRRTTRVLDKIVQRDRGAVMERLNAPIEWRTLDMNVLTRASIGLADLARYMPGDLVNVPRSDGGYSRGVVTHNYGDRLSVQMIEDNGTLATKTLDAKQVADANPLKVGDRLALGGKTVWVSGSDARGLFAYVDDDKGARKRIDQNQIAGLAYEASHRHAGQTIAGHALMGLPGYTHAPPDLQRGLNALLSLRGDPVFDRAAEKLRNRVKSDEFCSRPVADQVADLERLLKRSDHLHSVMPNFGHQRTNASSIAIGTTRWGNGADYFHLDSKTPMTRAVVTPVTLTVGTATKTFDIVLPESWTQAKREETFAELTKTLQALPPEVVVSLSSIVMNPVRNPGDAWFAQQFGVNDFTSAMTASERNRQITVYPSTSVASALQSFCHEAGHLVSIDAFGSIDASTPRWAAWEQALNADPIACSQYAKNNSQEDFAETFALYTSTKGTARHDMYRALMPHRFAILDDIAREAAR